MFPSIQHPKNFYHHSPVTEDSVEHENEQEYQQHKDSCCCKNISNKSGAFKGASIIDSCTDMYYSKEGNQYKVCCRQVGLVFFKGLDLYL